MVRFRCAAAAIALVAWCGPAAAAEPPALAKARGLYNAGRYGAAIESAAAARGDRQFGDAARLVIGRSHLERYREGSDPQDLSTAREILGTVRAGALSARDQVDLLIGLGQTLYFGDQFGAGGELFETALGRATLLTARDRQRLLEWWASALEREAQTRPPDRRAPIFARIAARMQEELAADAGGAVANYWLAAAARGGGDLERAWDAAVAGWVRSSVTRETTEFLRADLDRLVAEALIPELARTRPPREQQEAANALRVEWETIKEHWK